MLIWKNTKTLDGLIDSLEVTRDESKAEVALIGSKSIDLEKFPNLKGIFRVGVSRDNVPIKEANKRGIQIRFPSQKTIDYIYDETANFTCYLILKMCYNNIGTLDPWEKYSRIYLNNRELLIIGMGNIGKRVAEKMSKLMKVRSWDIMHNNIEDLNLMIRSADCITLHIPKTQENINFFNQEKMELMKKGSILINTSRGAIVSEEGLYKMLRDDHIIAAFDVFWEEPYFGKLKEFYPKTFFMTPHVGSTCKEFLEGSANELIQLVHGLEKSND